MGETLAFYRKLGFEITGSYPYPKNTTWVVVQRDAVVFQFHTDPPEGTPREPICTFYFYSESVTALAEELRGVVEFSWGPEVMDYGMLEFGIQDPNGYYSAFAKPA